MGVPAGDGDRMRPEVMLRLGDEEAAFQVEDLFDGFALYLPVIDDAGAITDFVLEFIDPNGMLFVPVEEQLGRGIREVFPNTVDGGSFDACVDVIRSGVPQRFRFPAPDASDRWVDTMAVRSGAFLALIYTDVSEQVRTERGLLESVAEFQSLARTLPDIVIRYDADLRVRFTNVAASAEFRLQDVIGRRVERMLDGPEYDTYLDRLRRVARTARSDRFVVEIDTRAFEIRLEPELGEDGALRAILSLGRDVTEQRRSEREREQTLQRLRTQAGLLDRATDAIHVRDLDGTVTYWNPAAEQMYGWSAAEAVGMHIDDLVNAGIRNCRPDIVEELRRDHEFQGRVEQVDRAGRSVQLELRLTLLPGDGGAPDQVLAIASDMTERVALEERLVQAQKLESVGQLTGGIAHDFNNLLTVIIGGADLIGQAVRDDSTLAPVARMIQSAGQKGAELTGRLLAFSRRQPLAPRLVDLGETIRSMSDLLRRSIGELVDIEVRLDPGLHPIAIDPGQFEATLVNLCINARDAMPEGGQLVIDARNRPRGIEAPDESGPGDVVVTVSDNGHGMPRHVLEHAFEPFFTTKDVGRGSGLGLSMVHGFVNQSGGTVSITSEPGSGTTVTLTLPAAQAEPSTGDPIVGTRALGDDETMEQSGTAQAGETILLVEDDDDVRAYASSVLRSLGYTVIEAGHGHDALRTVGGDDRIDLLFTDVVMPGRMTGWQVALEARRIRPALRVLYTSGYSEHAVGADDRPAGEVLRKPYRRSDLALHVRATLDSLD